MHCWLQAINTVSFTYLPSPHTTQAGAPPPAAIEPGPGGATQLLLVFANAAVANDAFAALPGAAGTDSVGRQQKQVDVTGGIRVSG